MLLGLSVLGDRPPRLNSNVFIRTLRFINGNPNFRAGALFLTQWTCAWSPSSIYQMII
ncbi:protein of unknown function (plasmid) [Caballeronia sp. S22]